MKVCTKCGETKPLDQFHRRDDSKDGRRSACKSCVRARQNAYYSQNREQVAQRAGSAYVANRAARIASARANYEVNRERYAITRKVYREGSRDQIAAKKRQSKYGLTPEADEALRNAYTRCAICDGAPERPLVVDHCHTSGSVRGLLCNNCNTGLGMFGDDADLLLAAIQYLGSAVDWRITEGRDAS